MTTSPSLKPHASIAPLPEGAPVLVCILDGWGAGVHEDKFNAVASADTPVVDKLKTVPGRYRTIKVRGGGEFEANDDARAWSQKLHRWKAKRKTSRESEESFKL